MLNAALDLYDESYEIIWGEKFMSPAANLGHSGIIGRLYLYIGTYCENVDNGGFVFTDNVDVNFPDGNIFKPDFIAVKKENEKILDWKGNINGVPDMVVEVLSKSTRKRDLTVKKDVYEKNGVGVYWIIDPFIKSVTVFNLRDGKFELDDEYIYFDEKEFSQLEDYEKADVKFEVPVTVFGDLKIQLAYIFKWCP